MACSLGAEPAEGREGSNQPNAKLPFSEASISPPPLPPKGSKAILKALQYRAEEISRPLGALKRKGI